MRPKILLVPGLWADGRAFARWTKEGRRLGFRVETVRLLGPAERIDRQVSVGDYVADVRRAIVKDDAPAILVGHSAGAIIAAKAAEGCPQVVGIVLAGSAAPRGVLLPLSVAVRMGKPHYLAAMISGGAFVVSRKDASKLILNRVAPADADAIYDGLALDSGKVARELALGVRLSRAAVPALVVSGRHDKMAPAAMQKTIASRLGAQLLETDHGHMLMVEEKAEETFKAILDWVDANVMR